MEDETAQYERFSALFPNRMKVAQCIDIRCHFKKLPGGMTSQLSSGFFGKFLQNMAEFCPTGLRLHINVINSFLDTKYFTFIQ